MEGDILNKCDMEVAFIRATHILKNGEKTPQLGVSKGENYYGDSHTFFPAAKIESEILAMQIVHFEKI